MTTRAKESPYALGKQALQHRSPDRNEYSEEGQRNHSAKQRVKVGTEKNWKNLHRNYPNEKAGKAKPGQDGKILLLQTAERDDFNKDRNCHRPAGDHVTDIPVKETTAVFCFDTLCEVLANLCHGVAVSITDRGDTALAFHPAQDRVLARRKRSRRILASRFERQRAAAIIETKKPSHGERNARRRESPPFLPAEAPIADVVGERWRDPPGG